MSCPSCGFDNPPNTRFCVRCNHDLQPDATHYSPDHQMKVVLPENPRPYEKPPIHAIMPAASKAHEAPATVMVPREEMLATPPLAPPPAAKASASPPPAEAEPARNRSDSKRGSKQAHAAKQATTFSIAIGTASVVLLGVAAGYLLLQRDRSPQADAPLPQVAISAPAAAPSMPAPVAEPVAAPAVESAPAPAVADAPASLAPAAPASAPIAEASAPHALTAAEITTLVRELQRQPAPRDCVAGSRGLVRNRNLTPQQAGRVAKQAWPELCAPAPKASAPIAVAEPAPPPPAPVVEAPPPPPAPKPRSLDEQYADRINTECSKGAFGHICRETVRLKMCSGKLSDNPPRGQSICKQ